MAKDGIEGGEHWRAALLREQFEHRGLHVIGLQETRATNQLLIQTVNYMRVIGGNNQGNGHHGCELWLSMQTPLGWKDGIPILFTKETTTVLCAESRLLAIRAQPAGTSFVLIVCHMPHEATDDAMKDHWWNRLNDVISRYSRLGFCFVMGDFNARFDTSNPPFVGGRLNGEGPDNGDRMRTLVEDRSMWLPSTFDDWHTGEDWTWTHARGTHARLDYVVIQLRNDVQVQNSYVDYDIQIPILHRDHELVRLDVICSVATCLEKKRSRRAYDWEKMATQQGQEILRQSLRQAPQVGWDTDVHQHWQQLEDYIHLQLQTHFPKPKCPRRHTIFSDQTWTQLDRRKTFKAKLCEWDGLWTESLLRWAICAWRIRATLVEGLCYVKFQLYTVILLQRFLLQGFRDAAFGLKQRVKHDKAEFIDQVASQAQSSKGLDIYQELKKLRIGSKIRKRGPSTLPGFGGAEDYNQSDQIWAEHCSKMEAAVQTTTSRLLQRCRQDGSRRLEDFSDFTYEHMPTLVELESSFRRIKSHKAGGLDDLKSDLCHLAPKELSEMFYPLLVKSFANLQEPLQAKGGILISAFKGGGGQWSRPEDHRSLLLSSHLGKAMRRTVRQKLLPFYTSTAPDLHCSVRAGRCVAHASHGLRLFAQACKQRHLSSGILFLDIRAAYYRVIIDNLQQCLRIRNGQKRNWQDFSFSSIWMWQSISNYVMDWLVVVNVFRAVSLYNLNTWLQKC